MRRQVHHAAVGDLVAVGWAVVVVVVSCARGAAAASQGEGVEDEAVVAG